MKSSEIRELSNQELLERIDNEKTALVRMRLNHAISPLDNPQKIKESRKTIARLMTEMRKREISKKTK
ncbi:MAG TPA: 50S ribosomal protein L29 [Bacteroidales bacterium]|jgi:large subunit ribosomal protein L29|nr:50S ribosomal protein L29 [Bacteroidales bacterium]MDI9533137.1 50S ribosomal protein L29 [Bacteroidota bacterium]OPZ55942.1 MAG: 50S ribosomal protein L29 [Bacteroidetes bacterium ADurb.BinA012]MBK7733065.1 50S ribosomal protein L29 [Bacteroidales bacterium]MZQ78654.1 50S ribosomal protein L29 [Bacteroidales bacterium]